MNHLLSPRISLLPFPSPICAPLSKCPNHTTCTIIIPWWLLLKLINQYIFDLFCSVHSFSLSLYFVWRIVRFFSLSLSLSLAGNQPHSIPFQLLVYVTHFNNILLYSFHLIWFYIFVCFLCEFHPFSIFDPPHTYTHTHIHASPKKTLFSSIFSSRHTYTQKSFF